MRKVAIVGAGQAGLLAAHALHQKDYEVTLYSDKTPDDFLEKARPTGTAARFDMSLDFERELGLEHWGDSAPQGEGVHLSFCPEQGNMLLTLLGRFNKNFLAIDVRLQSAIWLEELDMRGARIEIENVSLERLDEIAGQNDLTLVAAGRGDIRSLFPRDEERTSYAKPQRFLAMVNVVGPEFQFPYAPYFTPVKFNFFAPDGEMFWVPWYSKGNQRAWSLVFEAKEGGPIDRFREMKSAEETLERGKEVIKEMTPWDYEWVKDAEPCDENAWLVGTFVPEVRQVVGTLPSGRHVMAVGDTAQSLDPIGGQGANNGNKMTRVFVDSVVEREDKPFDADWMRATFDRFWERHHYIEMFNNTLLEPLTKPGQTILIAAYGSTATAGDTSPQQEVANRFVENFNDPAQMTPAYHDQALADRVVEDAYGSSSWPIITGKAKIGLGQVKQKLGRPAGHPGT